MDTQGKTSKAYIPNDNEVCSGKGISKAAYNTRMLVGKEIKKHYVSNLKILEIISTEMGIDDEDFKRYRKMILDAGNDTKRIVDEHLDRIKINYK